MHAWGHALAMITLAFRVLRRFGFLMHSMRVQIEGRVFESPSKAVHVSVSAEW